MPKNKRKSDSENAAEKQNGRSKTKRGKGLRTGTAMLVICAASFGAYYSPHFRAASSDWLERGRSLVARWSANAFSTQENDATADEKIDEKLAQAPSFRDFLNDEYGEEGARELLGIDAPAADVWENAEPREGAGGGATAAPSSSEPSASFADYVAAETAAEDIESQEVATGVDALLNSPIPESCASFADYVAAETALEVGKPREVADAAAESPTLEAEPSVADNAAAKPAVDFESDVWNANDEKTRLATADGAGEDETELAARLQDEMKVRGVGAPRIERWGGRFWRASGFATTNEGVATFCEAVDVDPTSAQRTALEKFEAARF